jgi:hypothetical protein
MKIVIENIQFPYDLGCRLLKLKNGDNCPFEELSDIWNDIQPLAFKDIAQFENLEQRRVGVICLGIDRLVSEVNPKLINKKALNKQTTWVAENGELVTKKFKDTYELYKVDGKYFSEGLKNSWEKMEDCYFVKCKDTSTDREYLIWVDVRSVYNTNFTAWEDRWNFDINKVNAIQCVAWTIQTDVAEGNIEKIIRQGDCILIKPIKTKDKVSVRHLTEKEYTDLLVAES